MTTKCLKALDDKDVSKTNTFSVGYQTIVLLIRMIQGVIVINGLKRSVLSNYSINKSATFNTQ